MYRSLLVSVLVSCLALVACDTKSPPPPSVTVPPAVENITGAERLGWNQQALDLVELLSFHYAIYVDGTRFELIDPSCAQTPTAAGFACTARLPPMPLGAHSLEFATFIVDGSAFESARSEPLNVIVVAATAANTAAAWEGLLTTADGVRLRAELVADNLDKPTDLAFAPDGRLFIAEQRGRVRVVRDGRLQAEPLLTVDDVALQGGGGLLDLVLDPGFDRNHFVYAVYTTRSQAGPPVFRLARFRELQNTLVDRVVLLDDVKASPTRASASLGFGPDAKLYAAFDDGGEDRLIGDLSSFSGKVLRLNSDASTPADQPAMTPVYSYGYRSPRGLDWQTAGLMWIGDGGLQGTARLSAIAAEDGRHGRGVVHTTYDLPRSTGVSSLAFYHSGLIPAFRDNLFVAAEEGSYVLRLRFDGHDPARLVLSEHLLQNRVDGVRLVRVGPDGAIYFSTPYSLGRLIPE